MTQANVLPSDRDFLDELRRVNSERYDAWVITEVPIMLCEHCGRTADDAAGAGSTHCNAPFVVQPHDFSKPHPYLTREVRTDAGIMFDALELGGEVGELLNVVKKLEREDRGWRGSRAAENDFADECGDVLICLDKLARRRGVNLIDATIAKFNATSEKVGLPHRLARHRDASVRELVPNTLLDELKAVKRAMEIVEFRAREPDLDLDQSRCRAILKDVLAALASAGAQP